MIRLDTHVLIWLYTGEIERFSPVAIAVIEHEELVVNPIVKLELDYLHEIGRLAVSGDVITADLDQRLGLGVSKLSMATVVAAASPLVWTRDPFDRLIVGDALAADCQLLTKDSTIREHCSVARW